MQKEAKSNNTDGEVINLINKKLTLLKDKGEQSVINFLK